MPLFVLRRLWRRISIPGYLRDVLLLFSGSALGKVLTVIAAPILARLFSPEDYGVLGLFTSFFSILVLAGSLGYSRAVVLPRSDRDAAGLAWLAFGILLAVTTVSGATVWFLRHVIAQSINAPALAPLLGWVPIAVFATGTFQIMEMWASRRKRFGQLSTANLARSTGTVGTQLGTGFSGFSSGGLIGGLAAGQVIAAIVLGLQQWRLDASTFKDGLSWKRMTKLARRHRDFPLLSLPAQLINSGGQASIPILLSLFFAPAVAGLYWFGNRLIAMVTESFGHAVRRVFYQRAAELFNSGSSVQRLLVRNTLMILGLGIVPALLVVLAGPPLFELIFGAEWREAGEYARWLVVMGLASLTTAPATELMYVCELQKWLLSLTILQLLVTIASIVIGGTAGDPLLAIILLSSSMTLVSLVYLFAVMRYVDRQFREELR